MSTALGTVEKGAFIGESNGLISTLDGDSLLLTSNAVKRQSDKGIVDEGYKLPSDKDREICSPEQ
jgi:hypothetical protein